MADFHAADLWVAVVPDVSKVGPEMEKAGKEAKGKFGDGVKGIGDKIHDEFEKVSEKAKDVFSRSGHEAGTGFAHEIGSTIKSEIGGHFKDIADNLRSGHIAGAIDSLQDKIKGIGDYAKDVGIDISGWVPDIKSTEGPMMDMGGKVRDVAKNVTDVSSIFSALPGKIGASAEKMTLLVGKAAGFAGIIAEALQSIKSADEWLERKFPFYHDLDEDFKNRGMNRYFKDWLGPGQGYHPFTPPPGSSVPLDPQDLLPGAAPLPGATAGPGQNPFDVIRRGGLPAPSSGPMPGMATSGAPPLPGMVPRSPTPSPSDGGGGGGDAGGSSFTKPSTSSITSGVTDMPSLHAAGSRVANLYAFAKGLVGTPYSTQLRNDCSGMVAELAAVAVGLPPPSSGQRFSTPNEGDWLFSHGFKEGMGGPGDLRIGWNPAPGMAGHTAATLPGGEHAEQGGSHPGFVIGAGAAGADSSQFSRHAYLPMGGGGGRGGGAGGSMPAGSQSDPVYTKDAANAGGSGGGDSSYEGQGKQLAQGFTSGIAEIFGLDGSVFKGFGGGKSPLDFGAVNMFKGLMGAIGGGGGSAAAGGGGGGMSSGLGAAISAAVGGGDNRAAAGLGSASTYHIDQSFNVHGIQDVKGLKEVANSGAAANRAPGYAAAAPG